MGAVPNVLLAIGSREDRRIVRRAVPPEAVVVETCNSEDARQVLRANPEIAVIVSDLTFSDGNWWCLYREAVERTGPTELIVLLPRPGLDASSIRAHGVRVLDRPLESARLARTVGESVNPAAVAVAE